MKPSDNGRVERCRTGRWLPTKQRFISLAVLESGIHSVSGGTNSVLYRRNKFCTPQAIAVLEYGIHSVSGAWEREEANLAHILIFPPFYWFNQSSNH